MAVTRRKPPEAIPRTERGHRGGEGGGDSRRWSGWGGHGLGVGSFGVNVVLGKAVGTGREVPGGGESRTPVPVGEVLSDRD